MSHYVALLPLRHDKTFSDDANTGIDSVGMNILKWLGDYRNVVEAFADGIQDDLGFALSVAPMGETSVKSHYMASEAE